MAYILVNTGSIANSDTADTIREGFHKVNSNFISLNTMETKKKFETVIEYEQETV